MMNFWLFLFLLELRASTVMYLPQPPQSRLPMFHVDKSTGMFPPEMFAAWESVFPEYKSTLAQAALEAELLAEELAPIPIAKKKKKSKPSSEISSMTNISRKSKKKASKQAKMDASSDIALDANHIGVSHVDVGSTDSHDTLEGFNIGDNIAHVDVALSDMHHSLEGFNIGDNIAHFDVASSDMHDSLDTSHVDIRDMLEGAQFGEVPVEVSARHAMLDVVPAVLHDSLHDSHVDVASSDLHDSPDVGLGASHIGVSHAALQDSLPDSNVSHIGDNNAHVASSNMYDFLENSHIGDNHVDIASSNMYDFLENSHIGDNHVDIALSDMHDVLESSHIGDNPIDVAPSDMHEDASHIGVSQVDAGSPDMHASLEGSPIDDSLHDPQEANVIVETPSIHHQSRSSSPTPILPSFLRGPRPIEIPEWWSPAWVSSAKALFEIRMYRYQFADAHFGAQFRQSESVVGAVQPTAVGNFILTTDISLLIPRRDDFPRTVFKAMSDDGMREFEIKYGDMNSDVYVKNEYEILSVLSRLGLSVQAPYYLSGTGDGRFLMESRLSVLQSLGPTIVSAGRMWLPWEVLSIIADAIQILHAIHQAGFVHGRVSEHVMRIGLNNDIVLSEFEFAWFYPDPSQAPVTDGINIYSSPFEMETTAREYGRNPDWMRQDTMEALPPTPRDDVFRALETIPRLLIGPTYLMQVMEAFATGRLMEFKMKHSFLQFDVFQGILNPVLEHVRNTAQPINYDFVIQSLRQVQHILAV